MPSCAAFGCTNRTGRKKCKRQLIVEKNKAVRFFKFPKEENKRKLWENAVQREGWTANDTSFLCSDHFEEGSFDRSMTITRLHDHAVPTIFPDLPNQLHENITKALPIIWEPIITVKVENSPHQSRNDAFENAPLKLPTVPKKTADKTTCISPRSKKSFEFPRITELQRKLTTVRQSYAKQMKHLRQKVRRKDKLISRLNDALSAFKKEYSMNNKDGLSLALDGTILTNRHETSLN